MNLEAVLTSRDGFGLEEATALQRFVARAIRGDDTTDLLVRCSQFERRCCDASIGCNAALLPVGAPPTEALYMAPVRTGKSLLLAALSSCFTQTVDVSIVKPGQEPPRVSVLATELDQAEAVRGHLQVIHERPALRALLIGDDSDSVTLRHPSGLPIQIRVIAAKRGGYSLAARWSAGVIFDEAPGWYSTDKIVSLEDSRDQALGRLLPGAQCIYAGSKWQPSGLCFQMHADHFGKPTSELVVVSPQEVN